MANVGNINVKLVAQSDQFTAGLDKAMTKLREFGGGVGGALKDFGGLAKMAGGTMVLAGATSKVEAALSSLGTTLVDAGHAFWEFIRPALAEIEHLAHLSKSLGVSTTALTGFAYAAKLSGVSAEHMEMGLRILSRKLGQLQQEVSGRGTGLGEAFLDESGEIQVATKGISAKFEQIGLNAQKLAGVSTRQAFLDIAEAIRALPTAAERGAAAFAIFGRQGQQLLPVLEQGKAGLEDLTEAAKKMGYAFDEEGAAKVEELQKAFHKIEARTEGLARVLAIEISPNVERAVTYFDKLIDSMGGTEKVVKRLGYAFYQTFKYMAPQYTIPLEKYLDHIAPAKTAASPLSKHGIDEDDEGSGKGDLEAALKAAKLNEAIEKVEKSLEKQLATFGMSKEAVSVWELEQLGASAAVLAHATALEKQVAALEEMKKVQETAKKIHHELGDELDKLSDKYKDLYDVATHGLLTRDEYLTGLGKAGADAVSKLHVAEAKGPRGFEAGSKQAFESLQEFRNFGENKGGDPVKALQKLQEQQNKIAAEHLAVGKKIEEALTRGDLKLPVVKVP